MPPCVVEVTFPEASVTLRFNSRKTAYKVVNDMEVKLANPASLVGTYTDDQEHILMVSTAKLKTAIICLR